MTKQSIVFRFEGRFRGHGIHEGDILDMPITVTLSKPLNPKAIKGMKRYFKVGTTLTVYPKDIISVDGYKIAA
jgi:hypothetical protein